MFFKQYNKIIYVIAIYTYYLTSIYIFIIYIGYRFSKENTGNALFSFD